MSETLRQKQSRFARAVGQLIEFAYAQGYQLTFGETYRTPAQAAADAEAGTGIARSLHCDRLAIDLNLFREGIYLAESEDHRPLGEYWCSLGNDYCWGGHFGRPDGNHYSLSYEGRQ